MRLPLIIVVMMAMVCLAARAEDRALLYKNKCALCHAENGKGRMGGTNSLVNSSYSADQIVALVLKGGAKAGRHTKPIAGIDAAEAKAIAEYVKKLK